MHDLATIQRLNAETPAPTETVFLSTVTIGRNANGLGMHHTAWDRFRAETGSVIKEALAGLDPAVEQHSGIGVWAGVVEDSTIFSIRTEAHIGADRIAWLKGELVKLAESYHQDAIALTVNNPVTLIRAD